MSEGPPGAETRHITAASADEANEEGAALARSAGELVAGGAAGAQVLPTVLSDVPVAILLIDLHDGVVTFANRAAVAMSGDVALPLSVSAWSVAAGLADVDGNPLSGSSATSLIDIAGRGEAPSLTIRLQADRGGARTLLWATGFPLPELEAEQALVILFEVADDDALGRTTLQERAIVATNIAFTITDPRQDDNPLVWVNPAFSAITGYSTDEAVGRNCRFLQGPASDPAAVTAIRAAIEAAEPLTTILLNYRKDGTAFWNQLAMSPVFDGGGELVSFVGVQADVTERIRADVERDRAYAEAQAARHRLSVLVEATGALESTLDVHDALARLAEMVVPELADWVVFATVDDDGAVDDVVVHQVEDLRPVLAGTEEQWKAGLAGPSLLRHVMETSEPLLSAELDESRLRASLADPALADLAVEAGVSSGVFVPLLSRRRRVLGGLALLSGPSGRVWAQDDLEVAADVGRRAGLVVDNARLYQREHAAAVTLQQSLLPAVPEVDGLTIAARYLPADTAAEVGGDFYEVIDLPDGKYGIAVGDVVGHDLTAAAAMGQLRVLLRTLAWDRTSEVAAGDPAEILARADDVMGSLVVTPMATVVFGLLERPDQPGGAWQLTLSNAGHPPVLLRHPDGSVERAGTVSDVLLGVMTDADRSSDCRLLPPGSVILGYTDGLIETPGRDLGDALDELEEALAGYPVGTSPGVIVDALTARLSGARRDDVALLAIGIDPA